MKMIKIYCIEDVNGLKYIGSTGKPLKHRLLKHKSKDNKCSSYKLDLYNSFIYTIEECDEENRNEREQYWIDNTECVNIINVIRDKKKRKEYEKQWYIDNLDRRKQLYNYQSSWCGDKRSNNNLLEIDIDIFN